MPDQESPQSLQTSPKTEDKPPFVTAVCSACGAHRPKEEIEHRACGNCLNLAALKEAYAAQAEQQKAVEKLEAEANEKLKNLPDLDSAQSVLYDNERGVAWIGVNLKSIRDKAGKEIEPNPVGLLLMLDQAKPHVLMKLADWQQRQAVKRKIILPKLNQSMQDVFKSAREAAAKGTADLKNKVKGMFALNLDK